MPHVRTKIGSITITNPFYAYTSVHIRYGCTYRGRLRKSVNNPFDHSHMAATWLLPPLICGCIIQFIGLGRWHYNNRSRPSSNFLWWLGIAIPAFLPMHCICPHACCWFSNRTFTPFSKHNTPKIPPCSRGFCVRRKHMCGCTHACKLDSNCN